MGCKSFKLTSQKGYTSPPRPNLELFNILIDIAALADFSITALHLLISRPGQLTISIAIGRTMPAR